MSLPAVIQPLPVTIDDPAETMKQLSWPEWLQRSARSLSLVSRVVTEDEVYRAVKLVPVIPQSKALTPEQRREIEHKVALGHAALVHEDIDRTLLRVYELRIQLGASILSEEGEKIKAQGYIIALKGVPTFAVIEACTRWLRGNAPWIHDGKEPRKPNYSFPPQPPELCHCAMSIVAVVGAQTARLERLLKAEVVPDEQIRAA